MEKADTLIKRLFSEFNGDKLIELKTASLLGFTGSIAHGTYVHQLSDDVDVIGVYTPRIDNYLGLSKWRKNDTRRIFENNWDIVLHEIRKFVHLCLYGNFNAISLLYLPSEYYIKKDTLGTLLIKNRDMFISKRIYFAIYGCAKSWYEKEVWGGYVGKYDYPTKIASEVVRLLRCGIELLNTGRFNVYRDEDRLELVDIKIRNVEFKEVCNLIDSLFKELEKAVANTKIPEYPNFDRINNLLTVAMAKHLLPSMMIAKE